MGSDTIVFMIIVLALVLAALVLNGRRSGRRTLWVSRDQRVKSAAAADVAAMLAEPGPVLATPEMEIPEGPLDEL